MQTALEIILGVLLATSLVTMVYWGFAIPRIIRTGRQLPTARAGLDLQLPDNPGSVCVVVPAHNEEDVIGDLIRSLRDQDYPNLRVVLALDRCTDNTECVAADAIGGDERFEIIPVSQCPDDWAGKVNAAWTGVTQSKLARDADMLLFTDADCTFDPGGVRASVAMLRHRNLDMLSLFSTLSSDRWFERLVQPAAGFELGRQYPLLRVNSDDRVRRRPFANGQFMLFDRAVYDEIGGHKAVYAALLEDIALARILYFDRKRAGLLLAGGMVRCRMYDTWPQFRTGWKRIFIESVRREPIRLRRYGWYMRTLNSTLPVLGLAAGAIAILAPTQPAWFGIAAGAVGIGSYFVWLTAMTLAYRISGASFVSTMLHPIAAWLASGIVLEGARDLRKCNPISWGGRSYVLEPRKRGQDTLRKLESEHASRSPQQHGRPS